MKYEQDQLDMPDLPDDPAMDAETQTVGMDMSPFTNKPEVTAEIINQAYEGVKTAIMRKQACDQDVMERSVTLERLETELKFRKAEAEIDGKNLGTNAEKREAFARQLFYAEYENITVAKDNLHEAQKVQAYMAMIVRMWEIECDRIDKLMDLITLDMASHQQ